jgi:hypothetical protein
MVRRAVATAARRLLWRMAYSFSNFLQPAVWQAM